MSLGSFKAVAADGFKAPCVSGSQGWIVVLLKGKCKHKDRPLCSPVLPATVVARRSCRVSQHIAAKLKQKSLQTTGFILHHRPSCVYRHGITLMDLWWGPAEVLVYGHRAPQEDLWPFLRTLITYVLSCIRILRLFWLVKVLLFISVWGQVG